MTQDTKMILGVAALVVAGAAGLAVLGVYSSNQEPDSQQPEGRVQTSVLPASYEEPSRPVIQTAAVEERAADPFLLDIPEVDFDVTVCDVDGETGRIARGLEYWEAAEYGSAAVCFGEEVSEGSERPWVHYMLGLSSWKNGDLDQASKAMTRAGELDDQSVKTFINLSRIQNDRSAYDEALEAAREALRIEPDNPTALFLEGRSLRNQGLREEALAVLRRSVDLDPGNGYAQNLLGLSLLEADRETEALPFLNAAADLLPDVPYIFNNLGMAEERCGNRHAAVVAYRRAVELDGGTGNSAGNLARLEPLETAEPTVEVAEAVN